jgi:hypothetical protein
MVQLRKWLWLLLLLGCAEDDAVRPGETSVRFEPLPGTILLEAYETAEFRARTDRGAPVAARWSLGGADQGVQSSYRFLGTAPGDVALAATAQYDGVEYTANWLLRVSQQSSSVTPPVVTLAAQPGAIVGSVALTWETPAASLILVPLREFELFIATSAFSEAQVDQMQPIVRPIDPNQIVQQYRIDGLNERQLHFLGIRVVDVLNRRSVLSPTTQSESTGHFDLTGSVEKLAPGVPASKGPGILIELGTNKVVTDQLGTFELLALPDLLREPLVVAEESGVAYYEFRSVGTWPSVTQQVDVSLFVKDFVFIDDGNAGGGFPDFLSTLDYLRLMSHNANKPAGTPQTIYRWENYPVEVYAAPYVFQGLEPVDYELAVARAVAAWNERAGEELLRLVSSPPAIGVDCKAGGLSHESLLGETVQLAPSGGIFETVPQRMQVRVRANFNVQATADKVAAHELGHVLMLSHSPSKTHLMVTSAGVEGDDWPHRDEAFAARVIRHLAQRFDLRAYRDPSAKHEALLPPLPNSHWCGVGPLRFGRSN